MKTLLCAVGRLENRYIREWVEYHKKLGFTNICLCDNNRDGEEYFEEVIGDYIKDGFVILKDYRNKENFQHECYRECYFEYESEYDWIAILDVDEFLTFINHSTIDEYLGQEKFNDFDMIHVNWMGYGDCERLYYEDEPVLSRFPFPVQPLNYQTNTIYPSNCQIKSIIRGGRKDKSKWENTVHTPTPNTMKCCSASGIECESNAIFNPIDFSEAFIRHYSVKSIDEYCDKLKRGFADSKDVDDQKTERLVGLLSGVFFRSCSFTEEKAKIIENKLKIKLIRRE